MAQEDLEDERSFDLLNGVEEVSDDAGIQHI